MDKSSEDIAAETLDLLDDRLRKIEFLLIGDIEAHSALQVSKNQRDATVADRISKLETALQNLSKKSDIVRELLDLYVAYPELFQPTTSKTVPPLTTSEILAMVASWATLYPSTASQLTAIQDLSIPSTESSAALITLRPQLARIELAQELQGQEIAGLRHRTTETMQRWYELGVLGGGDSWTEWESRTESVEKRVRQEEIVQTRKRETL